MMVPSPATIPQAKPVGLEPCDLDFFLNALPGKIAILDSSGNILRTNLAWTQPGFGWSGTEQANYLEACMQFKGAGAEHARAVANGIRAVLSGRLDHFSMDYPWHFSHECQWFAVQVSPLKASDGGATRVVVTHLDVTRVRLAEESAQWQEAMSLNARDPILLMDLNGRITEVNASAIAFYGHSREDLLTMRLKDLEEPELSRQIGCQQVGEDGGIFEAVHLQRNGNQVPVEVNSRVVSIGGRHHLLCVVRDLTERIQAENALRESEERFRLMVDCLPQLASITSPEGKVEWYNRRWLEFTGVSAERMKELDWMEILHPLCIPELMERWLKSQATGEPLEMELSMRGADGGYRMFLARTVPLKDASGKVLRWFGTSTDISALKEEEQRLRESEIRFRALAKATFEGVIISRNGIVLDANEQFAQMQGCSREEILGKPVADFVVPEDRERVQQVVCSGRRSSAEYRNLREDGSIYYVESHGRPILWDGRKARVSVLRDITERKRAQEEHASDFEFLNIVNSSRSLKELCKKAAKFLQTYTGCDAIAIRVREGESYPWMATLGFPEEFLAEDHGVCKVGCSKNRDTSPATPKTIDCLCGAVLNDESPVEAHEGVVVIPDLSQAAPILEEQLGEGYRGYCAKFGFESIAMIPFGPRTNWLGLVQLKSKRKGHFTRESLGYCKRWVGKLSIAVQKFLAQQALERVNNELEARVAERTAELKKKNEDLAAQILEKWKAHSSQQESEFRLSSLSDNIPNGAIFQFVRRADGSGSYTYFSRGVSQLYGLRSGLSIEELGVVESMVHPEDRERHVRERLEATRKLTLFEHEARICTPKGEVKWLQWKAAPRRMPNGDTVWDGVVADQTLRKQAELGAKRANRALKVLKECGEALVRAQCEEELLKSICQIVVETGSVKLAWVGIAGNEGGKPVHPTACAGEYAYLEGMHVSWGENKFGRGPTGTAIRTREIQICRNLTGIMPTATLRKRAVRFGLAAVIALPLVSGNRCLGALSIYSGQPDAFNEEEVELYKQLAADLAYGMTALRTRVEREELAQELLQISEREKIRMAQELHDGLCQHLAGTAFLGSTLHRRLSERNDPDAEELKSICHYLNVGASEARNIAHGLHPVHADPEGLTMALEKLARMTTHLYSRQCRFICHEPVLIENQGTANHLFRIAQESLNNAMKHGRAKVVKIQLSQNEKGITLRIQDNGVGISAAAQHSQGLGMRIMRQRAENIKAELSIKRAVKRGTVVTCFLPV